MRKVVLLAASLILMVGCDDEKLIKGHWKYQEGYHAGDWLDFEEKAYVQNDTVFVDSIPFAKFINVKMAVFGFPSKLQIANLNSGEMGTYVLK